MAGAVTAGILGCTGCCENDSTSKEDKKDDSTSDAKKEDGAVDVEYSIYYIKS